MTRERSLARYWTWHATLLALLAAVGCGKTSSQERIVGRWEGKIELKSMAVQQELDRVSGDQTLQAVVKKRFEDMTSMTMRVEFQANGDMKMSAEVGPITQSATGRWEVARQEGETIVIKSVESEGSQEELRVTFDGADSFTMDPPGSNKDIGVMRFRRLR